MCWIVFALPICIFMAFFTLRALGFEPINFMGYTDEEFYDLKNSSLYIVLKGNIYCLRTLNIVIGTVLGFVLDAFLYNSYIEVVTGIGGIVVVVGTAFAVVGAFVLLEKCFEKITKYVVVTV